MARVVEACLAPHTRARLDPNDYLLFPDDRHELPDDIDGQERAWMMKLQRSAG